MFMTAVLMARGLGWSPGQDPAPESWGGGDPEDPMPERGGYLVIVIAAFLMTLCLMAAAGGMR